MDFSEAVALVEGGTTPYEAARLLLARMSVEEKLWLLDGDTPFWEGRLASLTEGYNDRPIPAGHIERLGIPGIRFGDGPRGSVIGTTATCFPVPMARGATFDARLEERVGVAIGRETRANGANLLGAPCINLLRHPGWGRAQETYGEDPVLVGTLGAAFVRGAQRSVISCPKHFAANSIENSRHFVDVRIGERALHEVFLPAFKDAVDAGAGAVMAAYNKVNGVWCGHSSELLTDILRGDWGFDGFVISDFTWGVRDAVASLEAGLDIEMCYRMHRARHLPDAVSDGVISGRLVDETAIRILATQLRFAASVEAAPDPNVLGSPQHRVLAREVAARSIVVLDNDGILPLDPAALHRVAVIGALAGVPNLGDGGSSNLVPDDTVTPLDGLRAALPSIDVVHADDDPTVAADADVAVVVVGLTLGDEGEYLELSGQPEHLVPPFDDEDQRSRWEYVLAHQDEALVEAPGGDRRTLRLGPAQEELIRSVAAVNPRTVVVLMGGSAIVTAPWRDEVAGIVMLWYPGVEGGHALADVLLGVANPSGHLPFAVPVDEADLVPFDPDAETVEYGLLLGQWYLDAHTVDAAYPFGHGLSYTSFAPVDVDAQAREDQIRGSVRWSNSGDIAGIDVIQIYIEPPATSMFERPHRRLVWFDAVEVPAGDVVAVPFAFPLERLAVRHEGRWLIEPGTYTLRAMRDAADLDGPTSTIELTEQMLGASNVL